MAGIEPHDPRRTWHPRLTVPHFAPIPGRPSAPAMRLARMPTLGVFTLMRLIGKIGAPFRPWICVIRAHDYPHALGPTRCRRCGRSSLHDQGD